ncbi:hypothetical protein EDM00_06230 [Ornithobacterium rhinotracheale]|uniref:type II CRISPR RNA-guided endonuclease Cas9 n=2 Tax=Ornithobacterium rhinotracheale TaxID=28251 RepID=UPI00129D1786|nr:type II CRISPR RNA-guided endonuclease Cas9 [Ornithobacterium rhinotracheale]MRI63588.1 hypothetical protein [Ornithobacterium rhinotracheale]
MSKYLGLDLGSNSIGWAIRETNLDGNQFEDKGVLTFEKGVASEKGNEFPKVQKRTISRGKRRNYQAEKYRKYKLIEFLIAKGMCPLSIEELDTWRKYDKDKKRKYPQNPEFINWIRYDFDGDGKPDFQLFGADKHESLYIFREKAIDSNFKKVFDDNPMILGRIFYQLAQRRGFKGRDEEESKTIIEGKEHTAGRNRISAYIDKYKSLGAALYNFQKENGGRIRQQYTLRKDYENELKLICDVQNISKDDYKTLHKAIIWQRPLRTQKGLIGNCIYERNKKRAPISHPLYEEYRTWILINNLKIEAPKGENREEYLKNNIYPIFLKASSDFKIKSIIKQLDKDGAKMHARFNEETKVVSATLLNFFKTIFGEDWEEKLNWNNLNDRPKQPTKQTNKKYDYQDIWHVLYTFDDTEHLKDFAKNKLNLSDDLVERFAKFSLKKGYATLSISALKKILPYLRKGFIYSEAVFMANIPKVLGTNEISDGLIEYIAEEIRKILSNNYQQTQIANISNRLIEKNSAPEDFYQIENGRNLDDKEKKLAKDEIINFYGDESWHELSIEEQTEIQNEVESNFLTYLRKSNAERKRDRFIKPKRIHDSIFHFLKETYDLDDSRKKYLWHPSEQENYPAAKEYIKYSLNGETYYVPEENTDIFEKRNPRAEYENASKLLLGSPVPAKNGFKNPMALNTLHRLRKLINHLLAEDKIDSDTKIIVEIARELNTANMRKAYETWQRKREKENEGFKKIIEEINTETKSNYDINDSKLIRRIRLWEEQGRICLYTGNVIQMTEILDGSKYDFEHTIPASISFDSELSNLTLADKHFNNHIKGKKYPTQLSNYDEIKERISFMKDKIKKLKLELKDYQNKASFASSKEIKDNCIVRCHIIRFDLEYWQSKYNYFNVTEFKQSWRNSQLRDTQIITKYALPYLKTIFKKVTVEKGQVVSHFKKILGVDVSDDKKDRSLHTHHAQDAAVLTLIPFNASHRDRLLKKYFEDKKFRTKPENWKDFKAQYIIDFSNDTLINTQTENKQTLQSKKIVRKRGKIQYIDGTNKPKIAQGDTIRGQLFDETFYGAIKQPKKDENGKFLFDKNGNILLEDEIKLVVRRDLLYKKDAQSPGFKNLDEIKKVIVDEALFKMIEKQVKEGDFKTALTEGVYFLDKKGNKVNRIRRIRCFANLKTAVQVSEQDFKSNKEYKNYLLANNAENSACLFYEKDKDRAMQILRLIDLAELKPKSERDFFETPAFNEFEIKKDKKIPLKAVLHVGDRVLFYEKSPKEIYDLQDDYQEFSKRLFVIYQFKKDGRIKFRNHLLADNVTDLEKKYTIKTSFSTSEIPKLMRNTKANWTFLIENVDFKISLDGKIIFLD